MRDEMKDEENIKNNLRIHISISAPCATILTHNLSISAPQQTVLAPSPAPLKLKENRKKEKP